MIIPISRIFQAKLWRGRRLIEKPFGCTTGASCGGIAYIDPALRVNVADVLHQIAWYKATGMLKPEVDGNQIIDKRYVVPLP